MLRPLLIAACFAQSLTEAANTTRTNDSADQTAASGDGASLDGIEGDDLKSEDDVYSSVYGDLSYYDDETEQFYDQMNFIANAYSEDYVLGDTKDHCAEDDAGVNSLSGIL
jgi:hypothetical protein